MPSACPKTGIFVFCWMWVTSWLLPLGITRSMSLSSLSRSAISSRDVTKPMRSRGRPALSMASTITPWMHLFECEASFPPLRSRPFPLRMESDAIWGRASGLASKIMRRTPRGALTCSSSKPSATLVRRSLRPTGSSPSARLLMPLASWAIFPSLSFKRCRVAAGMSMFLAASRSLWFSCRITLSFSTRASAMLRRAFVRTEASRA
mmetsp:Transcript_3302/g.10000  ORF Transcript_3302/g.10000 Transcript_3302/m.10000 type:complete len:206 (+) Transcript_3302:206-823(+)